MISTIEAATAPSPERLDLILSQLDQLPTLPAIATRVLHTTMSKDSSAQDVIKLIAADQSLSAKILKLVGQASRGAGRGADTIDKAVVLLGFDAVRHAVLSIKVFDVFAAAPGAPTSHFDRQGFWKHCLAVGCASHLIAERWPGHVDPEVAFVCGLLHDIGKVALDTCLPKSYDRVVSIALGRHVSVIDVEQELLGVDHTVAGKRLAQQWQLPAHILECIWLHHHSPDMLPETVSNPDLVHIVNVADTWVREQRLGFSGTLLDGPTSTQLAEQLCMPSSMLSTIAPILIDTIEQRAELIGLAELPRGELYAEAVADANMELSKLNQKLLASNNELKARSRYLQLIQRFNNALHRHLTLSDVCKIAATSFRELIGAIGVAVYVRQPDSSICYLGLADEQGDLADIFSSEVEKDESAGHKSMLQNPRVVAAPRCSAPVRERLEARLGPAPHWMLPVVKDDELWGGILFHASTAEVDQLNRNVDELRIFATNLANVVINGYDRLNAERLSEGLALVNRQLKSAQAAECRTRSLGMVAEMAAGAAHELNNPLAVVSARAEILAEYTGEAKTRKGLQVIVEQAHRCSGIVNELMEFAKPDGPVTERLSISELIRGAVQKWHQELSLTPEQLSTKISDSDIWIEVDGAQIEAMLDELVKNAIEACDAQDVRVKIKCRGDVTDEVVVVTIEDNGCGMDASVVEKAGDPFFSHKAAGRGRGLGLSRATRWCEVNGGKLRIESRPQEGTQVWIEFPACR